MATYPNHRDRTCQRLTAALCIFMASAIGLAACGDDTAGTIESSTERPSTIATTQTTAAIIAPVPTSSTSTTAPSIPPETVPSTTTTAPPPIPVDTVPQSPSPEMPVTTTTIADPTAPEEPQSGIPRGCVLEHTTIVEGIPFEQRIVHLGSGRVVARSVDGGPWEPADWRDKCA